jgi:hypothetical protein
MKNTSKRFGIISVALVIGMVLAGCASTLLSLESDTIEGPRQVRQGEDIDPKSITVWGLYEDESRKVVSLSARNITFDKRTAGPQTVRVRVGSQEASFRTEVMALRSLTITSQPSTVLFKVGQEANRAWPGLEVTGEWNQMGSHRISIAACEITGYNKDQAGRQTVRVSYLGQAATFNVDVRAMTSIRIAAPPTKVDYLQGESLDLRGLSVMGVWEGFPEEQLSIVASDVTGFIGSNSGVQRLTVTKNGRSATFNVDVWALTGIALDKPPNKTDYSVGDRLDLTGIVVNATYAGSTASKRRTVTVPVNQLSTSGFNSNAAARQQRVTVTVGGQSANFFVNIIATPIGIWRDSDGYRWTFNAGGTGTTFKPGDSGDAHFKWTASGNRLTVEFFYDGKSLGVLPYLYGITGNTLTMQSVNTDGTVRTDVPIITLTRQ